MPKGDDLLNYFSPGSVSWSQPVTKSKKVKLPPKRIESPYLTAEEAAQYLRRTVKAIYGLIERGRLKPLPGSRILLFTTAALDECLRKPL